MGATPCVAIFSVIRACSNTSGSNYHDTQCGEGKTLARAILISLLSIVEMIFMGWCYQQLRRTKQVVSTSLFIKHRKQYITYWQRYRSKYTSLALFSSCRLFYLLWQSQLMLCIRALARLRHPRTYRIANNGPHGKRNSASIIKCNSSSHAERYVWQLNDASAASIFVSWLR